MVQHILIKSKRAQIWSIDLIISIVIFLASMMILYFYLINYSSQSTNQLDSLFYEGDLISQMLLTQDDFGILSLGRINQSKLDDFYNLNYTLMKKNFGVSHDFYVTIDNLDINGSQVSYIGKMNNSKIESLVQITRLTIYQNNPVKLQVYVWR